MSRLIGTQKKNSWYAVVLLLLILGGAGYLESIGFIDVISGFGEEQISED